MTDVVNFLAELFHVHKLGYSSISSARSSLSALNLHNQISKIGKHPLVTTFMRGVFNLRPPNPRYNVTWDASLLLNYLAMLNPLEDLTFAELTFKLVCLVSVITAARCATLATLQLDHMIDCSDRIIFDVVGLIKQSRPGFKNPRIIIRGFPQDTRICPLFVLRRYLHVSKQFRQQEKQGPLFISIQKPYLGVTPSTIGRWIKNTLTAAGVNTDVFTAHSVRSASVSKQNKKGVPVDFIMTNVGWSNARTVATYYNKPIIDQQEHTLNNLLECEYIFYII